jgi:hypothetical protein
VADDPGVVMIPRSLLFGLLLLSWGAVGSGGYYMGVQWANSANMKESINVLVADKAHTAESLSAVTASLAALNSKANYGISMKAAPR